MLSSLQLIWPHFSHREARDCSWAWSTTVVHLASRARSHIQRNAVRALKEPQPNNAVATEADTGQINVCSLSLLPVFTAVWLVGGAMLLFFCVWLVIRLSWKNNHNPHLVAQKEDFLPHSVSGADALKFCIPSQITWAALIWTALWRSLSEKLLKRAEEAIPEVTTDSSNL